jgi:EpsI family protein
LKNPGLPGFFIAPKYSDCAAMQDMIALAQPPAPQAQRRALILLGAGLALAATGQYVKPGDKVSNRVAPFNLDAMIPRQIGQWTQQDLESRTVNPQTKELLDKIYSQILERIYVNPDGYAIMVAVAYGADQRGTLEAHKPEVCYPAQGFSIEANQESELSTSHGVIHARQVYAVNDQRQEPLTYWFTMSNAQVDSRMAKRIQQIKSAITGQIPDGILFRVSSLDNNPEHAWSVQARFVQELVDLLPPIDRQRLVGLNK